MDTPVFPTPTPPPQNKAAFITSQIIGPSSSGMCSWGLPYILGCSSYNSPALAMWARTVIIDIKLISELNRLIPDIAKGAKRWSLAIINETQWPGSCWHLNEGIAFASGVAQNHTSCMSDGHWLHHLPFPLRKPNLFLGKDVFAIMLSYSHYCWLYKVFDWKDHGLYGIPQCSAYLFS